ncbi:MAG: WD40/YVTN/BNR-like repeat-containing protein, partial [Planctomycetota bacterium]
MRPIDLCARPGLAHVLVLFALAALSAAAQAQRPEPDRVLQPQDLHALKWRSIGPANMGGRLAAIALAPDHARTYFIGYGTGGVWKTTNNGTTFSPVFDEQATASIGSLAVCDAPPEWPGWAEAETAGETAERDKQGKAKIVWVGTGEGNGRNSSSWGNGVYRSTDGGATFEHVGLSDSHDIPSLAVDPRNPDVCYVAALGHLWGPNAERGVYKTTDGGETWAPVLQIDEHTGACDVLL